MRKFETGATRNLDEGKPDYEAYLSPLVISRYGEYMVKHAVQADGKVRGGDNWQKGIPFDSYIKSACRHILDWWLLHRGYKAREDNIEEALCAVIFNASGYLHELLVKQEKYNIQPTQVTEPRQERAAAAPRIVGLNCDPGDETYDPEAWRAHYSGTAYPIVDRDPGS